MHENSNNTKMTPKDSIKFRREENYEYVSDEEFIDTYQKELGWDEEAVEECKEIRRQYEQRFNEKITLHEAFNIIHGKELDKYLEADYRKENPPWYFWVILVAMLTYAFAQILGYLLGWELPRLR